MLNLWWKNDDEAVGFKMPDFSLSHVPNGRVAIMMPMWLCWGEGWRYRPTAPQDGADSDQLFCILSSYPGTRGQTVGGY